MIRASVAEIIRVGPDFSLDAYDVAAADNRFTLEAPEDAAQMTLNGTTKVAFADGPAEARMAITDDGVVGGRARQEDADAAGHSRHGADPNL